MNFSKPRFSTLALVCLAGVLIPPAALAAGAASAAQKPAPRPVAMAAKPGHVRTAASGSKVEITQFTSSSAPASKRQR